MFLKGNKLQQKYSDDLINSAIEYYLDHKESIKDVSKKFDLKFGILQYHLAKRDISRGRGLKTSCNEDIFEIIDIEEKAYWLGFLMADGNISKSSGGHYLKFSLQIKDGDAIYSFRRFLNFDGSIFENKGSLCISVGSKKIYDDLIKYGFSERKSGKEIIPFELIPDGLIRHFIRGYFDGDGCVSKRGHIRICCGIEFANMFGNNINPNFRIEKIKATDVVVNLCCTRKEYCKEFYEYCYRDSNIYLQRKFSRFVENYSFIK